MSSFDKSDGPTNTTLNGLKQFRKFNTDLTIETANLLEDSTIILETSSPEDVGMIEPPSRNRFKPIASKSLLVTPYNDVSPNGRYGINPNNYIDGRLSIITPSRRHRFNQLKNVTEIDDPKVMEGDNENESSFNQARSYNDEKIDINTILNKNLAEMDKNELDRIVEDYQKQDKQRRSRKNRYSRPNSKPFIRSSLEIKTQTSTEQGLETNNKIDSKVPSPIGKDNPVQINSQNNKENNTADVTIVPELAIPRSSLSPPERKAQDNYQYQKSNSNIVKEPSMIDKDNTPLNINQTNHASQVTENLALMSGNLASSPSIPNQNMPSPLSSRSPKSIQFAKSQSPKSRGKIPTPLAGNNPNSNNFRDLRSKPSNEINNIQEENNRPSTTYDLILRKKNLNNQSSGKSISGEFSRAKQPFPNRRTGLHYAFHDPMDIYDEEERMIKDIINKEQSHKSFYITNFSLQNFNIKITEFQPLNELSAYYYNNNNQNSYSKITTITALSNKFIICGDINGAIGVYNFNQKLLFTLIPKKLKKINVSALDISINGKYIAAGYSDGSIIVWNVKKKSIIISILVKDKYFNNPIEIIKIWREKGVSIISSDQLGRILCTKSVTEYAYTKIENDWIIKGKSLHITNIAILNQQVENFNQLDKFGNPCYVCAISAIENVLICLLEPKVIILHKIPVLSFIEDPFLQPPNISWGYGMFNSLQKHIDIYLVLAWANTLLLIKVTTGKALNFTYIGYTTLNRTILFVSCIGLNIIIAIDDNQCIHVINSSEFKEAKYKPLISAENFMKARFASGLSEELNEPMIPTSYSDDKDELEELEKIINYTEELPFTLKCHFLALNFKNSKTINNLREIFYNPAQENQEDLNDILLYNKAIFVIPEKYQILYIAEDKIYNMKLMHWKEYLNTLTNNNHWIMFFIVAVDIYQGTFREVYGIPFGEEDKQKIMIPYFIDKLKQFIDINLMGSKSNELHNNKKEAKKVILCVIDFCLALKLTTLLFSVFRKLFESLNLGNKFIKYLKPFIDCHHIKEMPIMELNDIIDWYMNNYNNKNTNITSKTNTNIDSILMEKLIINLNYSKSFNNAGIEQLRQICIKYKLYYSLIYLSFYTRSNFMIPINLILNDYSSIEDKEKVKSIGKMCLWYIKLCFKGKKLLTPHKMSDNLWLQIIQEIIPYIYNIKNYRMLLDIDTNIMINLTIYLFDSDITFLIKNNMEKLQINDFLNDYYLSRTLIPKDNQNHKNVFYQIYFATLYHLNNLKNNPKPIKKTGFETNYENILYYFLSKISSSLLLSLSIISYRTIDYIYGPKRSFIMYNNNSDYETSAKQGKYSFLDKDMCYNAILYLLKNHISLNYNNIIMSYYKISLPLLDDSGRQINHNKEIEKILETDYIDIQKHKIIMDLLRYVEIYLTKDKISELFAISATSTFTQATSYLYYLKGDYQKSFEIFLTSADIPEIQIKIFDWIEFMLIKCQNTNLAAYQELKNFVATKISNLFYISLEDTKELIEKHFFESVENIILNLAEYPELQLELLEKYIENHKTDLEIENHFITLYISLLCRTNEKSDKNKIIQLLNTYHYEDEVVRQICKKYNQKEILVIIEERSENYEKAMRLNIEVLQELLQEIDEKPSLINSIWEIDYKERLLNCLRMIKKIDNIGNTEEIWFWLFGEITKFSKMLGSKVNQTSAFHTLKSIVDNIIEALLYELLKSCPIIKIFNEINIHSKNANFGFLSKFLQISLQNTSFESKLIKACNMFAGQYSRNYIQKYKNINDTAFSSGIYCIECMKPFENSDVVTFPCRHNFHKECSRANICIICADFLEKYGENIIWSLLNKSSQPISRRAARIRGTRLILEEELNNLNAKLANKLREENPKQIKEDRAKKALSLFDQGINKSLSYYFDSQKLFRQPKRTYYQF